MKKCFLFFYFLIFLNGLKAQTDSLELEPIDFTENNIIKGTAALSISGHQMSAWNYGLFFDSILETPCKQDYLERSEESRIEALILNDSSLIIGAKIIDNCCFSFICDIQILEDSILNLMAYGYGETHCACNCCYGLDYYLSIGNYGDDHKFNHITSVMINNERKTIWKLAKK